MGIQGCRYGAAATPGFPNQLPGFSLLAPFLLGKTTNKLMEVKPKSCIKCSSPIPLERLSILPETTICVRCQQYIEDLGKRQEIRRAVREVVEKQTEHFSTQKPCPQCRSRLTVRLNKTRNTFFLGCRNYPDCTYAENFNNNIRCSRCDIPMVPRQGRFGYFWGCRNYPRCKKTVQAT
ncbi:MAG: topoisomerase DNA-binding C4 zinc finger domain-containing protein [Elusimicrobia bacterium]|nr:topoisomerase DNA-binding C4 zinc finger domain-containing protein [Elusimicrobiota bacterium]